MTTPLHRYQVYGFAHGSGAHCFMCGGHELGPYVDQVVIAKDETAAKDEALAREINNFKHIEHYEFIRLAWVHEPTVRLLPAISLDPDLYDTVTYLWSVSPDHGVIIASPLPPEKEE